MFDTLYSPQIRAVKPNPSWLRLVWLVAAPLGLALAARIFWEKTLLTAEQGEQMIGFSLIHIHPGFFLAGVLCSCVLLGWLIPAVVYLVRARFRVAFYDYGMMVGSLFVLAALLLPDNFGLRLR